MKTKKTLIRILSIVVTALILLSICVMATGCGNKRIFDTTWTFERAIIFLPDGEKIEGKIAHWDDYEGSDMIQVTIDGKTYLTHSTNVIMISE